VKQADGLGFDETDVADSAYGQAMVNTALSGTGALD